MGSTPGQGRQVSKGPEREYSFFQGTAKEVWSIGTGDLRLLQKEGYRETEETQGASD